MYIVVRNDILKYRSFITVPSNYVHGICPCLGPIPFLLQSHLYSWITYVMYVIMFCCRAMSVDMSQESSLSTLATELLNENPEGKI
jgi:hypothetical protein